MGSLEGVSNASTVDPGAALLQGDTAAFYVLRGGGGTVHQEVEIFT